ncbi:MAG TPA: serine hydrolase domain-containing protein [Gryllotalpicola sp.]
MTQQLPGFPQATAAEVGLSDEGLDRIDAVIQDHIQQNKIAGAVTLVARHGKLVRTGVFGVDRLADSRPYELDSIFHLFSMTKPITGLAMGILADRGLWHPEDPISAHLPELAELKVLKGVGASGEPIVTAADRQPTMLQLMTHTAGFAYGTGLGSTDDIGRLYLQDPPLRAADLDEFVARVARLPLAYQPGTTWRYSISMDLQGAIIERLSGQSLPEFYRTNIFEPLGMVDTDFFVPASKRDRLAELHYGDEQTPFTPVDNPLFEDAEEPPRVAWGGQGLFGTAPDYARFAQLLLNGGVWDGKRIVSEAAMSAQMHNHLPEALLEQRFTAGHMHFRPGFGYGYNGAVVYDPARAELPVGENSYFWDGAAGTWFWSDPANELLFVGMIQQLSWQAPPLQEITQRLMADAIVIPGKDA